MIIDKLLPDFILEHLDQTLNGFFLDKSQVKWRGSRDYLTIYIYSTID